MFGIGRSRNIPPFLFEKINIEGNSMNLKEEMEFFASGKTSKVDYFGEGSYLDNKENDVSDEGAQWSSLSPAEKLARKKEKEAQKLKGSVSHKTAATCAHAIISELKLAQFKGTPYPQIDKELRIKVGTLADEYEDKSKEEREKVKSDKEKYKNTKVVLATEITAKVREFLA